MDDTPIHDPIVEEFQQVRDKFNERFGNDLKRMGEYLMKLDSECDRPRIKGTPRPAGTPLIIERSRDNDISLSEPPSDPILAEIRRVRDELAREFNADASQLGEYLRRLQKESGREYVSGTPRPPRTDSMPNRDADAA